MTKMCRCGRPVIVADRIDVPGGATITLDVSAPTYMIVSHDLANAKAKLTRGYIDHEMVCRYTTTKKRKKAQR